MAPDLEMQDMLSTHSEEFDEKSPLQDTFDRTSECIDNPMWLSETRTLATHSIPLVGTYLLQYFCKFD